MPHSKPRPETDETPPSAPAEAVGDGDGIATVLGKIPSGLFVVTWRADEGDRGMLASWVMQAGFDPPMVTIAVGTSRDLLAAVAKGSSFVINVLGESQRSLLARFGRPATPGENPFSGLDVIRTSCGAAAIAGAAGWLECSGVAETRAGEHVIVLAEVKAGKAGSKEPPLVHLRRNGLRY